MRRPLIFLAVILQLGVTGLPAAGDDNSPVPPKAAAAAAVPADEGLFGKMPLVEAATLHAQTLEDAPASVSVVTATEIRKYGYRTLGEALSSVRGFYFTNDRMYDYSGVRGLAIPGDWNTRYLVMLSGHPLTENIFNSNNAFGQDFGLDMDLVERIEIIRGPSSALYGSNGMLANINIVTKSPIDLPQFRASTETGSFGEKKAMLSSSLDLGRGANLLISGSVFNDAGRKLYYPDFDTPENDGGMAHHIDAQRGYHTFANLVWGQWSFTGLFNSREARIPALGSQTLFDEQGNRIRDSRNLIGANYTRDVGKSGKLRWHAYYDQFRENVRVDYPLEEGQIEDNRSINLGDWVNSQLTYSFPVRKLGTLTAGIEGSLELRNLQTSQDVSPVPLTILTVRAPDRSGALFVQQECPLARHWTAYFGLRFDHSRNFGNFASPRLALVYRPSERTSYKLVYGRPFRNPSAFERYYDDGLSFVSNRRLTRETAQAFEASVERKLRTNLSAIVNAYDYRLRGVVQSVWVSDTRSQYQNAGARRSTGVEFEVRGSPRWWLEATGSFVVQRASDGDLGQRLPNSPSRIGKARLAVPVLRNKIDLSGGLQYLSARLTSQGTLLRPVALADATVSTRHLFRGYDLVCGVRNALNWQYDQPVDFSMGQVRANGRTFFVKLIWQQGD